MRPERFSLEGRPIRKVRQSVTRLEKAGYRVEIVTPDGVSAPAARRSCSRSRSAGAAAGRSAASRWRWTPSSPTPTRCSRSRSARRRGRRLPAARPVARLPRLLAGGDAPPAPARPNGLMEFAIVRDDRMGARARRCNEVSLNFSVFAEYLRADGDAAAHAAARDRPALPARAAAQLQPQVLPRVAAPLLLLRALDGAAAGGARLPPRRVAADPARARGRAACATRRPRRAVERLYSRRLRRRTLRTPGPSAA